jgi:putative ABC transport system permease protein
MRAMRALNKKLLRDLWKLRGQVMAVSVVIASGVAVLVMSLTTLQALKDTSALFYERYQFADVFAGLKRAPNRLQHRLEAIPGVQFVETRVSKFAVLDVAGFDEPLTGRIVGIRAGEGPRLNRPKLRSGRFLTPGRIDEVIVSEMFAEAQGLELGTTFWAIMDGSKRKLTVVGTGVSPEFVYAIAPGSLMPDDKRSGILWMDNKALSAANNLDGAFNDVALTLLHGVTPESVIPRVDVLLSRYGGTGAIARKDQISNWFLMNEIEGLKTLATILPTIFLFVSGLLTHAVLTRLVATERSEIGLLKAFGYSDIEVGWHYAKLVVTLAGLGTVLGWMVGSVLGRYNTEIYARLYNLPDLYFQPGAFPYALSAVISIVVALAGALQAVRGATTLSPAAAMRPPEPTAFRHPGLYPGPLGRSFDQDFAAADIPLGAAGRVFLYRFCLGDGSADHGAAMEGRDWRDRRQLLFQGAEADDDGGVERGQQRDGRIRLSPSSGRPRRGTGQVRQREAAKRKQHASRLDRRRARRGNA